MLGGWSTRRWEEEKRYEKGEEEDGKGIGWEGRVRLPRRRQRVEGRRKERWRNECKSVPVPVLEKLGAEAGTCPVLA